MNSNKKLFYGWYVVLCSVILYFLSNGLAILLPPVYYPILIKEFTSNEASISSLGSITMLTAGLLGPFGGILIDRLGVKSMMRIGVILLASSLTAYGFTTSLIQAQIVHLCLAISLTFCGLYVNVVLLSNWFSAKRGTAIGILIAGSSLAGTILPNIISRIITNYGWRWSYWVSSGLVWVIAIPLTFLIIRENPFEMNLCPDGIIPKEIQKDSEKNSQFLSGVRLSEALKTKAFYFLALGSSLIWCVVFSIQNHLVLYLKKDLKMDYNLATFLLSLFFAFSLCGKLGFGFLADTFEKRKIMILTTSLLFIGSLLLFNYSNGNISITTSYTQLKIFTIFFGLGYGGTFSLIQLLVQECFGRIEIGRILGTIMLIDTIGATAGIYMTGMLRKNSGNYLLSFEIVVGLALVSLINVYFIKPLARDSAREYVNA